MAALLERTACAVQPPPAWNHHVIHRNPISLLVFVLVLIIQSTEAMQSCTGGELVLVLHAFVCTRCQCAFEMVCQSRSLCVLPLFRSSVLLLFRATSMYHFDRKDDTRRPHPIQCSRMCRLYILSSSRLCVLCTIAYCSAVCHLAAPPCRTIFQLQFLLHLQLFLHLLAASPAILVPPPAPPPAPPLILYEPSRETRVCPPRAFPLTH